MIARLLKWDEWRGSLDGKPTHYTKAITTLFGYRISLHKFVSTDDPECFHSHPATAFRVILWGGCEEEIQINENQIYLHKRGAGHCGFVPPHLVHRIHRLLNGRASYSLWICGQKTHETNLIGKGWAAQTQPATIVTQDVRPAP